MKILNRKPKTEPTVDLTDREVVIDLIQRIQQTYACPNCSSLEGWNQIEMPARFECKTCGFWAQPETPTPNRPHKTLAF